MTLVDAPVAPDATWHRLSPRMLLVHPVVEVARALPALLGVFVAGTSQGHNYWGLIAAGVVAGLSLTRWFTTRLRVTPDSVQLQHGLLRRRTIATKRDRIRTVDVTAHVLHRLLGLSRVVIGTGISDRKGEGRMVLDGLTVEAAAGLRDELLHRLPEPMPPTPSAAAETELIRLNRSWIRFAPFTLSGAITGLVIYGFAWRIQGESGVDIWRSGPLAAVRHTLDRMPLAAAVALVTLSVVVFVTVTSTAGYVLAFWNFRLVRREGGTLQVTRGLLTTRATSIERQRLVGVQVSEALVLRAVGGARVLAVATGLRVGRGAEIGGEVLLPPAPKAAADAVARRLLDGTPVTDVPLTAHGPAARRRRVNRAVAGGVIAAAGSGAGWLAGGPVALLAGAAVVLAGSVLLGLDRYRNLGHALVDGYLVTRSGSLVRRRTALAGEAVIGWNLRTTFFQRRTGVTTLTATTAAGRQGYRVQDLPPEQALALAQAITPDLLGQFRVPSRGDPPPPRGRARSADRDHVTGEGARNAGRGRMAGSARQHRQKAGTPMSSTSSLAGKTILMSGGSRGIGLAIAVRAARDGANVAILAKTDTPDPRLPGTIHTAAAEIEAAGGAALPIVGDVREEDSVARAVERTVEQFGGIDIVVNNASAINLANIGDLPVKRYDLMLDINARGTFVLTSLALPHLARAENPHVLTLSPPLSLDRRWLADHAPYTLSKFGMTMLTLGVAESRREQGIAANCLWPRTLIATAAVQNIVGGDAAMAVSRKPEIMADAAREILIKPARECTGNTFVDEDVLAAAGITDLSGYRFQPGSDDDLQADIFL